ncbi:hypothetical protein [Desulfoluna sp.]|nr:hypothetical protein [Desulfoluna sp.]
MVNELPSIQKMAWMITGVGASGMGVSRFGQGPWEAGSSKGLAC